MRLESLPEPIINATHQQIDDRVKELLVQGISEVGTGLVDDPAKKLAQLKQEVAGLPTTLFYNCRVNNVF